MLYAVSDGLAIRTAIGAALRQRRLAGEMSLATVAERAGLSAGHISEVERGVKDLSTDRLARACAALEVDPADLFRDVSTKLSTIGPAPANAEAVRPASHARLLQATEHLSPQSLRTVAEFSAYLASKEPAGRAGHKIGFEF